MIWPEKDKPYFDLVPQVIPDFFTETEYKGLYDLIEKNNQDRDDRNEPMGYFSRNIEMEEPYLSKIIEQVNKVYPIDPDLSKGCFVYNRYTWKTGNPPTLKPHFDTMIESGAITLSIVLDNTIDWDIVAEDQTFGIYKNEAFMFSGTHHLHWRPKIEFGPDDYYDFLLCQFIDKNPVTLDEKYWEQMVANRAEKSTEWWRQYESDQV